MIHIKSQREIEMMREAGSITARILHEVAEAARPGITTFELDEIAERRCKDLGVKPAFKGYQGFPGSLCVSLNHEVIHGIPSSKRTMKSGDIIGLDFGVVYEGFYGDAAISVPIGKITPEAERLLKVTEESLNLGIQQARPGNHLFDISHAIQNCVEAVGFSVVREFVGHGIGRSLHEDPQVPNFGPKGKGVLLKEGMVLAIEPMINAGGHAVRIEADGWTATTVDGSLSAHFEHTVAITEDGPEILTRYEGDNQ
ncbi:MAG: type I methionyl aminopeptidase [Deltaproteobacteria bacterium]|nr:type I methionyl aminopeptidase [Deltaproteobacteria bacterium]